MNKIEIAMLISHTIVFAFGAALGMIEGYRSGKNDTKEEMCKIYEEKSEENEVNGHSDEAPGK